MQDDLEIEVALRNSKGGYFAKYSLMKERLLNFEYEHWAAGFPEGNNHGPSHILRVLEYLDQLLRPNPLDHITPYELFLAMMGVLYHDIGILHQRQDHGEISKRMLEEDAGDAYIINPIDKEIIAAAVVSHSGHKDIAIECQRFNETERVGGDTARPRTVAALVRLADELDEDHRRANPLLEKRLRLPENSRFYWLFCQRVRGIHLDASTKHIDFHFAPEPDDTKTYGPVQGGSTRHFMAFAADKLAKINQERVNANRFLPTPLRYSGLRILVTPLRRHPTWTQPRAFVFNDLTPAGTFLQNYPELLEEACKEAIVAILRLMRDGALEAAEEALLDLQLAESDLPISVRLSIPYELACVYSMRARIAQRDSNERSALLDRSVAELTRWFAIGTEKGAFAAAARIDSAEVHRMAADRDLDTVVRYRRAALEAAIPQRLWPTVETSETPAQSEPHGSGCLPRGTLVETPRGRVAVELLALGDSVYSMNLSGERKLIVAQVARVFAARAPQCIRINGHVLLTPTQPVLTPEGWLEAGALGSHDSVVDGEGRAVPITGLDVVSDYFEVFDLCTNHDSHNFIAEGILVHNKYPAHLLDEKWRI